MALTTAEAFCEFETRIALTEDQRSRVESRAARVQEYLEDFFPNTYDLPLRSSQLMGSAARGTIIRPLDDIDVLATFANKNNIFEQYRHDSKAFLYRLTKRIQAKTTIQQVGARGQAVRLFYTDGLHVDIAPVFKWNGEGYGLPSGSGQWITVDPPKQATWASERERVLNRQFKKLTRTLKRWNSVHSSRLGSWHLEVMVGKMFSSLGSDHRDAVSKFFKAAPDYLNVEDPDGHGGDLSRSLTWNQESAIKDSFKAGYTRATNALAAESKGNHAEAIRIWRIVFGDEFPAYG